MKIQVTFELDEDSFYADPTHVMGVTNAGYENLVDHLANQFGADDIEVERVG